MTMLKKILFPFTFLLSFLIFSSIVTKLKVPILEGQKFGNIPLERKIQKLIELEKSDGVDAIILGASNTEFGVSAQVLSETVTLATGKKFVAYNFGTGGADFYLLADLIKIVELHVKPKYYFLQGYHLSSAILESLSEDSLYKKLRGSPVGSFLDYKILLPVVDKVWNQKTLLALPSLRSKIVFSVYLTPPSTNSDVYPLNKYGDSISYNYLYLNQGMELVKLAEKFFLDKYLPISIDSYPPNEDAEKKKAFFTSNGLNVFLNTGYRKIQKETSFSETKFYIISFPKLAIESTFPKTGQSKELNRRFSSFFTEISKLLNIGYIDAYENTNLKSWHVQDDTHYNTFAAEIIGRKLAEKFLNQTLPNSPEPNDDALFELEKEKLMGRWTSIIRSPKDLEENILIVKYLQNANTHKLPPSSEKVNLIIRLEKNNSQIFPAQRIDSNSYQVEIPKNLLKANAMYAADLLNSANISLSAPLESYSWEKK
jgi:hypothetical protein